MKKLLTIVILLCSLSISAHALAATIWYGWDSNLGLVAYDADTGAKNDLPGPGLYNMSLGLNPVNGEMWGYTSNNIYSIDRTTGNFTLEYTIAYSGEASSFDLAGNFFITSSTDLYQVDLSNGNTTFVRNISIQPDGFDILPDGRWIANDSNTIYVLDSNWNVVSQWSGPADETIAADEAGRVFGSNGSNLNEIDIVNQTSTLLWTDNTANSMFGSEAFSGGIVRAPTEPVPTLSQWGLLLLTGLMILMGLKGLVRRQNI